MSKAAITPMLPCGEKLLTTKEVATLLKVDPTTVRRWIKQKSLPAISIPEKIGRQRQTHRIKKSVIDAILDTPDGNRR